MVKISLVFLCLYRAQLSSFLTWRFCCRKTASGDGCGYLKGFFWRRFKDGIWRVLGEYFEVVWRLEWGWYKVVKVYEDDDVWWVEDEHLEFEWRRWRWLMMFFIFGCCWSWCSWLSPGMKIERVWFYKGKFTITYESLLVSYILTNTKHTLHTHVYIWETNI